MPCSGGVLRSIRAFEGEKWGNAFHDVRGTTGGVKSNVCFVGAGTDDGSPAMDAAHCQRGTKEDGMYRAGEDRTTEAILPNDLDSPASTPTRRWQPAAR